MWLYAETRKIVQIKSGTITAIILRMWTHIFPQTWWTRKHWDRRAEILFKGRNLLPSSESWNIFHKVYLEPLIVREEFCQNEVKILCFTKSELLAPIQPFKLYNSLLCKPLRPRNISNPGSTLTLNKQTRHKSLPTSREHYLKQASATGWVRRRAWAKDEWSRKFISLQSNAASVAAADAAQAEEDTTGSNGH